MPELKNEQSGFSLIELLVAMVILAIGLIGLVGLQVSAIKTNAHSQGLVAASAVAQMFLEDVAYWSEDDLRLDADANGLSDWQGGSVSVAGSGTFIVTYDVDADYQAVDGVSKVTVHVANQQVSTMLGQGLKTVTISTLKRAF